LVLLIRSGEAEELMATVDGSALTDSDYADLITIRFANLLWPMADAVASAAVIRQLSAEPGPSTRAAVGVAGAVQLAFTAQPRKALAALTTVDPEVQGDLQTAYRCWAETLALGDLGRTAAALDSARRGFAIGQRSEKAAYQGVGLAEFAVSGCLHAGHVGEALRLADEISRRCTDVPGIIPAVAAAITGMAELGASRVDVACERLSAALEVFERLGDTSGLIYRYRIVLAEALARRGDVAAAQDAERAMLRAHHPSFGFVDVDALLARAWVAAASGDPRRALDLSAGAVSTAARSGQIAREVVALQTAVGMGATGCASRLAELSGIAEGPRVASALRYAEALERGDGERLLDVSREFEAFGDLLTAADAAALAARTFQVLGRRNDALDANERVGRLLRVTGASIPAMRADLT
ncbi:MAG TPA: hypothetical protein VMD51_14290, partial [Mycobacterium sp.]|nr:hypothetical protein [Mycobacterium sp.]